ncbi:MAG: hypothetical protein P8177_05555 [Gemmatimonadota bacterium]|jgi:hypothetical protein
MVTATEAVRVTCGFCGTEFVEDVGQPTCEACPLSKACGFVRCPECGYENPRPPRWLDTIRKWVGR